MSIEEQIYIVAGDEMQKLMSGVYPGRKIIPFREDLSKGCYEGFIFDNKFISNRANYWNVSIDDYEEKMSPIINLEVGEQYTLCFGEDACCKANLKFLIEYLKYKGYSNTIYVQIVNEYNLEILKSYQVQIK